MIEITQAMIGLYDDFTHGRLARDAFEARMAEAAGSPEAASEAERAIAADAARPPVVAADDPQIAAERVAVRGGRPGLSGYLCRPAGAGAALPGVLVVHENRGLNPHIEDVTRRVALEGFLALGLDFLSSEGGTPADEDAARELIGSQDAAAVDGDAHAAMAYLREAGNGRTGAVGFCWGGAVVNRLATRDSELDAAVVYYGRAPEAEDARRIRAAVQLHYAGLDEKVNATAPGYLAALHAAGVAFERHDYPGTNHAFNNDASAARYHPEAAALAWGRTIAFLRRALGATPA